jgi:lipopolysaccharide export system permease protein
MTPPGLTTLDRYLLRRFLATLFKALLALVGLYVLIDLLTQRGDDIDSAETSWLVVARYYIASTPFIVANYAAPFAALVTALLVLGDTAQNNETTAALASGISLRRFVRMPLAAGAAFALAVLAIQETVGVEAARDAIDIEQNYFSRSPDTERSPVSWARLNGQWRCHVMKFNRIAMTGEDVLIYTLSADAQYMISARRIYWDRDDDRWMLERGTWLAYDPQTREQRSRRITQEPAPFNETPERLFALEQPPRTRDAAQLRDDIAYAEARNLRTAPLRVGYHAKFAQPALAFVMVLLAVPFAMRLRRGGLAISFGAGIAIAIAYLLLYFVAQVLGEMGHLSPALAAWLANLVFGATGLVMFFRTPT